MSLTYTIETFPHPEGGWMWRILGETQDYGSVILESEEPLSYQEDAEAEARQAIKDNFCGCGENMSCSKANE